MTFPTLRSTFVALASIAVLAINTQAATVNVYIYDMDFSTDASHASALDPVVNVGDTVHWIWDVGLHSTEAAAGQLEVWDSEIHFPAFSFDHTFTHEGVFNYYCDVHGADAGNGQVTGMSGNITVVPEPGMLALVGTGLGLAAFARRLRSRDS